MEQNDADACYTSELHETHPAEPCTEVGLSGNEGSISSNPERSKLPVKENLENKSVVGPHCRTPKRLSQDMESSSVILEDVQMDFVKEESVSSQESWQGTTWEIASPFLMTAEGEGTEEVHDCDVNVKEESRPAVKESENELLVCAQLEAHGGLSKEVESSSDELEAVQMVFVKEEPASNGESWENTTEEEPTSWLPMSTEIKESEEIDECDINEKVSLTHIKVRGMSLERRRVVGSKEENLGASTVTGYLDDQRVGTSREVCESVCVTGTPPGAVFRNRHARYRAQQSQADRNKRLARNRERQALRRRAETQREREIRLAKHRERQACKRRAETQGEKEIRLAKVRERNARMREREREERRVARLARKSESQARRRRAETQGEREIRLAKVREHNARMRMMETKEAREARLARKRESQARRRRAETQGEKETRLAKVWEHNARMRKMEADEGRGRRLAKAREHIAHWSE